MLCQNCGKSEANVKYTQIVNGVKKEMVLCEECSKGLDIGKEAFNFNMPINLSSFLSEFLQEEEPNFLQEMMPQTSLTCDKCHMTYEDFMNNGKFGCSHCYEVFCDKIDPLLKNLHGVSTHVGRGISIPQNTKENQKSSTLSDSVKKERKSDKITKKRALENDLKLAIQEERYEDAAKIRDEIKKIEKEQGE